MDLDLNLPADHELPHANSSFENYLFDWNLDCNQERDREQIISSPRQPSQDIEGDLSESSSDEILDEEDENFDASITMAIEKRLAPGCILESMDHAYLLYCEYARATGFSVKKGTQKYYIRSAEVRAKEFMCSCHGKSNAKQMQDRLHVYRKQDYRCMCEARLRVVRELDGKWRVSIFNKTHNHELADKEHSYLLRSSRQMSHAKKSLLEALHSAGIQISTACRFMEQESGGPQNTGFTRKDAYHHIDNVKRKSKLDDTDSNALQDYFVNKSNKEPLFYWKMQKDEEGRLMNFFFRDSRAATDYEFFGDVLSVDTTYKTNKYDLICAPFIGVNHHMKNCMFGLAFLSNETTATFEWLFSTFLDSMQGKEPQVIFSDQCQAMMNGIDSIFKTSSHRLCQWHINQNTPSHFGNLNGNSDFKRNWFNCMNGCESEDEFEAIWSKMIEDYGLKENRWFRSMYKLRRRWASVFTSKKFCAGLHATSRSEATNRVLKDLCRASGSLYDFVMKYERVQLDWRRMEGQDDTTCLGTPGLLVEHNHLLKQAAKFFTRDVFMSYQHEATHSINVNIEETLHGEDESVVFVVQSSTSPSRSRRVTYNPTISEASCTCCMWETVGVLCSHIFKIYYHLNVGSIPTKYLLRRLSRDAKRRRCSDISLGDDATFNPLQHGENIAFKSHVMRTAYEIIDDINMNKAMYTHLLRGLTVLGDEIRAMASPGMEGLNVDGENIENASKMPKCRDPKKPAKRRNTNTRLSNHWEKSQGKGKKRSARARGSVSNYFHKTFDLKHYNYYVLLLYF